MARTGSRGSPEAGHRASHRPPARREAPEHTRGGGGRCESPWPTTEAGSETQKPLHLIRGRNTTSCTGSAARPRRPSAARGAYAAEKLFFQTPELFFSLVPSPRKVAGSLLAPPGARSLCSLQLESGKLRVRPTCFQVQGTHRASIHSAAARSPGPRDSGRAKTGPWVLRPANVGGWEMARLSTLLRIQEEAVLAAPARTTRTGLSPQRSRPGRDCSAARLGARLGARSSEASGGRAPPPCGDPRERLACELAGSQGH